MRSQLLPIRLGIAMLMSVGLLLLAAMVWISTWPRDGGRAGAAFVNPDLLPGHRFQPEILARLGEIGGGALGVGLALLIVERILARREKRKSARL